MSKKENTTTPDPATLPEPAPTPSRAVLLNRFANLQEKVTRLTDELVLTKEAMLRTATVLRDTYHIIVSDSVHTTPVSLASSPVPTVAAPARIDEMVEIEEEPPSVAPEDNPMLKAAQTQGISIGRPRTAPASEAEIAEIRRGAAVGGSEGAVEKGFSASINKTFDRAVRAGLGKP